MIKLTRRAVHDECEAILVNPDHIVMAEPATDHTVLHLISGQVRRVTETLQQIRQQIHAETALILQ